MRTARLARIAIGVALASALALVSIQWGQGGKISLEMLPILVLGLWEGTGAGVLTGVLFGFLDILKENIVVHPVQVLLDYPLAFGVLGLVGLSRPAIAASHVPVTLAAVSVAVVCLLRTALHVISGTYYFPPYNFQGSLAYNVSYMLPSTVMCTLLVPLIWRRLEMIRRD